MNENGLDKEKHQVFLGGRLRAILALDSYLILMLFFQ